MNGIPARFLCAALFLAGAAVAEEAPPWAANASAYFAETVALGAHRGGRDQWPENTALAFAECAKRFPKVVLEGDIQTTRDGQVVFLHDLTVDRTTDGTGSVQEMSFEEARALDAAHHFTTDGGKTFPHRGQGVVLPTLAEALAVAPEHRFFVEMKGGEGIVEATIAAIRAARAEPRIMVASFNPVLIHQFRAQAPDILTCYDSTSAMLMFTTLRSGDWAGYRPAAPLLTLSPGLAERFKITADEIAAVKAKGIVYQKHTINRREEMEAMLARGVESFLTDRPDLLAEVLESATGVVYR